MSEPPFIHKKKQKSVISVKQQAYFQELQTKQQNEFQKMLMQMMKSDYAINE